MVISRVGCRLITDVPDVYALSPVPELLQIQTYYEGMHLADGRTIRYLKFALPAEPIDWKAVNLATDEEAAAGKY